MPVIEDKTLPKNLLELKNLVARRKGEFTKSFEKMARFAFANPGDMAFYSRPKLAGICGVSVSTVQRFVTSLGFKSYGDFRALFRAELREITRRLSPRLEASATHPKIQPSLSDCDTDVFG